ncbi:MAG: phenylacetate--CoA ligase family protein [bacterium]
MAFADYFDEKLYRIQNTPEVKQIQLEKLRRHLARFYQQSPAVRMFVDSQGIAPEKMTLEAFRLGFPLLGQGTLRGSVASEGSREPGYIVQVISGMLGIDPSEYVLMCATSGTTGEPTPYFFTAEDLDFMPRGTSRGMYMVTQGNLEEIKRMRAVQAFGLSMFGAGVPLVECLIRLGVGCIPVGAEAGTDRILKFAERFAANCIWCTPSLAEYMVDTALERIRAIGFKYVFCGAEPGAGIPEVRQKIESGFQTKLYDGMGLIGGLTLFSCGEEEYAGMHHLTDDMFLFELVDPETKETIPWEDQAVGEMVMTPLQGCTIPPGRFSSGDVAQLFLAPCKCGAPGWRIKMRGRTDDMLKVKGVIVYPAAVDGVITGFVPRLTGEFRIVLDAPPPRVEPPLKLKVEYGEGVREEDLEGLGKELEAEMHAKLKVRPRITWVPPMTLERAAHKTKFIEKAYEEKK